MKTLKRSLSLVLALVLALSLCSVAFASNYDDFSDSDKVTYTEAVDVLIGIKAVEGTAGKLNPQEPYTRAQGAALIARIALGRTAADRLSTATAPFTDVPTTHWAAGYIAYCVNEGIIDGYGDGTFGPDDPLTGYAALKMILCAIGYGEKGEFTGSGWVIEVAKLAMSNLLTSDSAISDGDVYTKLINGSDADLADAATREEAMLYAFNALLVYKVTYSSLLGEYNYGGTFYSNYSTLANIHGLYWNTPESPDAFGRPMDRQWFTGNAKAVSDAYGASVALTYTTEVTGGKIFSDLGLKAKDTVDTEESWIDGVDNGASEVEYNGADKFGGNGCLTEVYYDAVSKEVIVVEINTYFDTVKSVTPVAGAVDRYITLDDANETFTTDDFAADDAVLYTIADGDVQSVVAATSATVVATSRTATSFVAGGKSYKYSATNSASYIAIADVTGKNEKVIYFDSYGYVIAVEDPTAATPNYAVVLRTGRTLDQWNTYTYVAQLLYADGSVDTVDTNEDGYDDFDAGDIVTYAAGTGADTGLIVLTSRAAVSANTAVIDRGKVAFTAANGSHRANSQTIFLVKTVSSSGVASYASYTGISNVPSITRATNSTVYTATVGGYATVVYVDTAVLATGGQTSTDVIYVDYSSGVPTADATKGEYVVYNAVVNGVVTTIEAKSGVITADAILGSVTKDDNGIITGSTVLSGTGIALEIAGTATVKAAYGVVTLNSEELTYNDNTVVYYVTGSGITKASGVSAIETDTNDAVCYYTTDGVLTAVYITVVAPVA